MTTYREGRRWVLEVAAPGDWKPELRRGKTVLVAKPQWLTLNSRLHWRTKDRIKKKWRAAAKNAAGAALDERGRRVALPVGEVKRARFDAVICFPTKAGRRDIINWHDTTKVIIDTLTAGNAKYPGWGFLPDDATKQYLHCGDCPHLREHPDKLATRPPFGPVGMVVMTITELLGEVVDVDA